MQSVRTPGKKSQLLRRLRESAGFTEEPSIATRHLISSKDVSLGRGQRYLQRFRTRQRSRNLVGAAIFRANFIFNLALVEFCGHGDKRNPGLLQHQSATPAFGGENQRLCALPEMAGAW